MFRKVEKGSIKRAGKKTLGKKGNESMKKGKREQDKGRKIEDRKTNMIKGP